MKIIIITGQTATGKTSLALKLSSKENGQLINSDSRQIYKDLNIITGKDIPRKSKIQTQRLKVSQKNNFVLTKTVNNKFDIGYYWLTNNQLSTKIWLYDIVDPKQYFSSFDYQQLSLFVIKKLLKENKTPIIVGGTYFYLNHLLYNVETEKIHPDWNLRKKLKNTSLEKLQEKLKNINPQLFNHLNQSDKKNPQRLIRKIEISQELKNKQQSSIKFKLKKQFILSEKLGIKNLDIEFIGLKFKRKEDLKQAIKNRVEKRLKNKAIEEVKTLLRKGYMETDPGLKTIGYQQIIRYLKGKISKEQAIQEWINKEIQYAKRQLTFMKKDPHIVWLNIDRKS